MSVEVLNRIKRCAIEVWPGAKKTTLWVVKITSIVSVIIFILQCLNVIPALSKAIGPVMKFIGLPGEAALAYVSGYFVNVYSCIAAAATLNLSARSVTILAVLVLCSHNMIVETAVQKKTGSSALRIALTRTLSGVILAFILNKILPQEAVNQVGVAASQSFSFAEKFWPWLLSLLRLCIKMTVIIYSLSVLQQILKEFGLIQRLCKLLKWPLKFFGLGESSSFLWIIANTLGLAYGAAVMIQEREKGNIGLKEIKLLNTHICISHSNLEDLILFISVGAIWWIVLLTRWAGSFILVWEERFEFYLKEKFTKKC